MKKSCLLAVLCLALTAWPVMAEETEKEKASSLIEEARALIEAEDYKAAVPLLQEAADTGNADGQNMLGNCYMSGLGIEQDEKEAVKYYQLAADQGNILAEYNLALSYLNGEGVEQDAAKAEELLKACADQGDAESQTILGNCYLYGEGLKQNYEKAAEYLQLAADQENAPACYLLGICFENGWGVEQDYVKAADYYKLAADQGLDCAQYNLGLLYQLGNGVEQDYEKAFEYYSLSAEQDYPQAQTALGFFYNQGLGTQQDYEKMLEYYNLAAEQGESMAQFNLGCCYRDGTGVRQDYKEMIRYFELAADQGNANAQFNLGFQYYIGEGVEQDYDKAFQLFQLSAEQGFPAAMFAYGDCYYLGNGVKQDLKKAAEWYQKALDAGYEPDDEDQKHLKEVLGENAAAQTEMETEQESTLEGQLTLEEISALNGGEEKVFMHNDRVTMVDGTCTDGPVESMKDAAAVWGSMMTLIGADAGTKFAPWREITDPMGHHYYIFQQIYKDTTVCGGAVKVITDEDGNMIALTSSIETRMPDVEPRERISAQEAEQIVVKREYESSGRTLEVLDQYTGRVILPAVMGIDMERKDSSSRLVWVIYTNNPSGNVQTGSDLPYLAHYVTMTGEYLYNMPAIMPDDKAGKSGYDSSYVFEFMEPAEYTGYVVLSTGEEKEITVTLMRDRRTGMYYLGNIERRIVVGQCYDFLYNDGQIVLESSQDNLEWDQVGLLSLYNYCRAYDYYKEIGWIGGDGLGTPILILNNFCDDHYNGINNACYIGKINGMQCFAASCINDLSQCLDVIAHEFTHCVTRSATTYNSYMNDYGAINEAMSDIQGKNCEMMAGDADISNWTIGSGSKTPIRNMSDPHEIAQPEFSWDVYYVPNVKKPSPSNDHGGVHSNSSLLNEISYYLVSEGGMTLDEARTFWFMVDCAMVPQTDYTQLSELLPWALKAAGMEQYEDTLEDAIEKTRLGEHDMPENIDEDRAVLTVSLPDTEAFDTGNWMMSLTSVKVDQAIEYVKDTLSQLKAGDFSSLPESLHLLIEGKNMEKDQKTEAPGLDEAVLDFLSSLAKEKEEKQTEVPAQQDEAKTLLAEEVMAWLQSELRDIVTSSHGFAGQDGSTITMITTPGRTIPLLQHTKYSESSSQPDEIVIAAYIKGRWYSISMDEIMEMRSEGKKLRIDDMPSEMSEDIFGKDYENLAGIRNLDDALDLFTVNIEGGQVVELSSEGLDRIVIPDPTPPEEKQYGSLVKGPKSRPKLETEETEELTLAA